MKLKEREEQRLIKERIREEEKAQREAEKEELLRKALEKARREFEKAGDEQKSKYAAGPGLSNGRPSTTRRRSSAL